MTVTQIQDRAPFVPPQARLLEVVAGHVRRRSCILFLGAGVHYPPPDESPFLYPVHHRPPLARELSRILARDTDFEEAIPGDDPTNLRRVSLYYEFTYGRAELVNRISETLAHCRPSPLLNALAQLDFPVIVTTNYDDLAEQALRAAGKKPQSCVYNKSGTTRTEDIVGMATPETPAVLKIHGDLSERESIVVTEEDYIHFIMRMGDKDDFNPVPQSFRVALQKMPTLFVGYSLTDYNLRALFRTLRWRTDPANIPGTYSVDVRPDPLVRGVLGTPPRVVNFIVDDIWAVVPHLYQLVVGKEMGA